MDKIISKVRNLTEYRMGDIKLTKKTEEWPPKGTVCVILKQCCMDKGASGSHISEGASKSTVDKSALKIFFKFYSKTAVMLSS